MSLNVEFVLPLLTSLLLVSALQPTQAVERRDPKKWPFARNSIWNSPIGDQAIYVPAEIQEARARGMTIDEDIIVLRPDETSQTTVYYSSVGWSDGSQRCISYDDDRILFDGLPIPADFIVSPDTWDGLRPNSGLACLLPDGETIVQTQPFAKCETNIATSLTSSVPPVSLYGDGIRGAHGGSGLSAIGGAVRVGELVPGGTIRHVLKVNLFGRNNLYHNVEGEPDDRIGYRWPAIRADGGFDDPERTTYYGGSNPSLQMGSLLALHKDEDLGDLRTNSLGIVTEPALILARAVGIFANNSRRDYSHTYIVLVVSRLRSLCCGQYGLGRLRHHRGMGTRRPCGR